MESVRLGASKGANVNRSSVDTAQLPTEMRIYIRDPVTGLRSQYAPQRLSKIMRKLDMPLVWQVTT